MARDGPGGFDWDRHNVGHVARHKVTKAEVEQVLKNDPDFVGEQISESGEKRFLELGHTDKIRVLFVAWTLRGKLIRPVTAFDASKEIRSAYLINRFGVNEQ